jgi:protein-tyrosine kinase
MSHAAVRQTDAGTTTAGSALQQRDRSIGAILVDAGRLTIQDAELVLRLQRQENLRFGDAAIKLGVLTRTDIDFALSRQFSYPYLVRGTSKVSVDLAAAYLPFSSHVEALRALRSQLALRWFDGDGAHRALAIVSADHKEGRSYITANLAIVFAQLGGSTLLIDADMRAPCQHKLFGLENRVGLSTVLSGRGSAGIIHPVPGLLGLSVVPAGPLPPNPLELLSRPVFDQVLRAVGNKFDVILLDTPPAARFTDAQIVAVRTGAALIVVRNHASRTWRVRGVSDAVNLPSSRILGAVLNDF